MSNRHIVDELAEVRAQIKALADRETALKAEISAAMGTGDLLIGDDYAAVQKITSRKGAVDTAAMAKAGIDVEAYRRADVTVLSIVVERCQQAVAA